MIRGRGMDTGDAQPAVGAAIWLSSPRRIPFNEPGIFCHHPELDLN